MAHHLLATLPLVARIVWHLVAARFILSRRVGIAPTGGGSLWVARSAAANCAAPA